MRKLAGFLLIKRTFCNATKTVVKESTSERSYPRMSGWQIHSYGELDEVQFSKSLKKPFIRSPKELLVKVDASSVNPLDVQMISGYGSTAINTIRCNTDNIEFPLTLGRDFVGTVVHKGLNCNEYKIGDKIWGVIPVQKQGCHAEFVSVDTCYVSKKPSNITDVEAAAILYAGLTAYSGIFLSAQLNGLSGLLCSSVQGNGVGKKVLVLGGAGGVGHIAIQILQAEGAEVLTTCSQNAVPLMENLGVSKVIDYTTVESDKILVAESPYDIILDCAGKGTEYANVHPWKFKNYVTFKSPLLKNFDEQGMLIGGFNNLKNLLSQNIGALSGSGVVKWGYFVPLKNGITYLTQLVERKQLVPIIDSKFSYDELPKAYEKVMDGHLRGKVVIEH
ncbi:reticulon-4-interacting protein 1 homolog, mitochondrial-like [Chironomus tepperi]|uniref:reticulon-4-interacting protein 1 homolog, mitochondrial-like n=1 Tax=Chironomus tepperi TaxID=113505 RepID=UPI00391F41A1